jgi:hypothetical protein
VRQAAQLVEVAEERQAAGRGRRHPPSIAALQARRRPLGGDQKEGEQRYDEHGEQSEKCSGGHACAVDQRTVVRRPEWRSCHPLEGEPQWH